MPKIPLKVSRIPLQYKAITLFVLLLLGPPTLWGQETTIKDVVVVNSRTDLLVFFSLQEGFNKELNEGVQHGIPITFTFDVKLKMIRDGWFDKTVASQSFEHTLTYDNLKRNYTVIRGEIEDGQLVTNDFMEAKRFMVTVNAAPLIPLDNMIPDQKYILSVKATLAKTTLPLNFQYLVPFSEFWDLNTPWTEVHFTY